MLVLSRKRNQEIIIDGPTSTVIRVIEIRGNHVKLGIEADRTLRIVRNEIANMRPRPRKK